MKWLSHHPYGEQGVAESAGKKKEKKATGAK